MKYLGPKTDSANVATQSDITGGGAPLSNSAPDSLEPDQTGAAGSSTDAARADHQHAIAAASAGTITGTNAEGTSTSFARADHNHDLSITPSWTAPTFAAGWTNYGGGFNAAGYYKDKFGFVHLKGLVKRTSGSSVAIFTLPSGFRPIGRMLYVVRTDTGAGRIDILNDGDVRLESGGVAYVQLDGLYFPHT